jgi:aspartate dehydrogenase
VSRLGIIGYGAIADLALGAVAAHRFAPLDEVVCLARETGLERAASLLDRGGERLARRRRVVSALADLLDSRPDVIVEAAGHQAVRESGPQILKAGVDLVISSVGALSDQDLHERLLRAAQSGRARIQFVAGAIGGLDILAAARLSGIEEVVYVSRKPPAAWAGTPAEQRVDLAKLVQETVLYEGNAAAAANDFPKNANVAATVALAGLGFSRTRVKLVADPNSTANVHEISFRAACADVSIRIEGRPSPRNPKTSATTGYSLAHLILDRFVQEPT